MAIAQERMTPQSIKADNEELVVEVDSERKLLQQTIQTAGQLEGQKSELIEKACRILWDLWQDEEKREVMGWASWEDLFHPGNEELQEFFELIDDRIVLGSESNRQRFYNLLLIDSDPTIAEEHLLRRRHWTPVTQFESRISRLKQVMKEPDGEEKAERVKEILEPVPQEKQDPEPLDNDFVMKREVGYWRGKPAIRVDNDSPLAVKLKSRITLVKALFFLKKGDSEIIAMNDEKTEKVATVLLPQSDPDYLDYVGWLDRRLGIKVVS